MKYWSLIWSRLPANAMALFPVMLFKKAGLKNNPVLVNHEKIHFRQQLELLILPFYVLYLLHYIVNLIRYKNHDRAYFQISFEKEAYANDQDMNYLKRRRPYAWLNYFK
jgi:hypothetical protein